MLKQLFQFLSLLLLTQNSIAQFTISGSVIDKARTDAIPFASLTIEHNDTLIRTKTDINGQFQITIFEMDTTRLKITAFGFHPFDSTFIAYSDTVHLTVELKEDTVKDYSFLLAHYNKEGALKDIENGTINLLLPGGFGGSGRLPGDADFEKKYSLTFISQGCVRFSGENETEYNQEIFKYLDDIFGEAWREEIRTDVIGLENE